MMEDNLTKAKKYLMKPKELCPTASVVQTMQTQGSISLHESKDIAKMQKTLIKKEREYSRTFPKYDRRIEERTRLVSKNLLSCQRVKSRDGWSRSSKVRDLWSNGG